MGVVQSSVVTEAAALGALVAGTATAYAVYKRGADVDTARSTEEKSPSVTVPTGGKKSKGKKRKDARASAGTAAGGTNNSDAELDELLERAKAEAATERAEAEARRAASKGLVPGAFDQDVTGTALSSEAESTKNKKSRKKGRKAVAPGAAAVPSSSVVRDGDGDKKAAPAEAVSPKAQPSAPVRATTDSAGPSKKSKKRKGAKGADDTSATVGSASGAASSAVDVKPVSKRSNAPSLQSSQVLGMSVTMSDAPEDASWTRVSTRKKSQQPGRAEVAQPDPELLTSDTNLTTSGVTDPENNTEEDEGSAQEPEKRRTFAERMLPRPRKTGVEDMEDEPLQPTLARVIRVKPVPGEKPVEGFTWGDYEEFAQADSGTSADGDADDAWEEVKSKKKNKLDRNVTSSADSLSHSSAPASAAAMSKRQRQNAEKREASRLEKEAQERERQERLARHRRELERERIAEQFAKSGSGSKKTVSGGMKASVDDGKLVWEA